MKDSLKEEIKKQTRRRELWWHKNSNHLQERLSAGRHPDFKKIYRDFQKVRNGIPAQTLYEQFVESHKLDETKPYDNDQVRFKQTALKSKMHQTIKKEYPQFNWDNLITGIGSFSKRRTVTTIIIDDLSDLKYLLIDGKPITEVKIVW